MGRVSDIIEAIEAVDRAEKTEDVFSVLEKALSVIGSQHLLVTGIPMPGQKINDLVIHNKWKNGKNGHYHVPDASDLVIQKSIDWPASFVLRKRFHDTSGLAIAAGLPQSDLEMLIIPVISNFPYQGVVITTFERTESYKEAISESSMSFTEQSALSNLVSALFYKLKQIGVLSLERHGELTKREREIVSLSALGKKSGEMAKKLGISERTVIAHLQNASMKLGASNRTQCVLQAIRYNQIGPGAGLGFYQLEAEIYKD